MSTLRIEAEGPVSIITIDRPQARNSVDAATAQLLADAFRSFDADPERSVAVLTGADGCFCAGADLKEGAAGRGKQVVTSHDILQRPSPKDDQLQTFRVDVRLDRIADRPGQPRAWLLLVWRRIPINGRGVVCRVLAVPNVVVDLEKSSRVEKDTISRT